MGSEADAFDLPGAGPCAALCLHGLTGRPYEVRPLAEALAARGVRALGPDLPGHAESPEAIAAHTHAEWLEDARAHLAGLRERHDRVFLVGVSLGGLISLALAGETPVAAVVVVGTPLRLRFPLPWLVPVFKHVYPFAEKRAGSDIRDPEARRRHPSHPRMPLHAVHELQRLQARVRAGLGRVRAPILVAHGAHDRTANPSDARAIYDAVASTDKELLVLDASAHVATVDHDGPRLAHAVADFLGRFTGESGGSERPLTSPTGAS